MRYVSRWLASRGHRLSTLAPLYYSYLPHRRRLSSGTSMLGVKAIETSNEVSNSRSHPHLRHTNPTTGEEQDEEPAAGVRRLLFTCPLWTFSVCTTQPLLKRIQKYNLDVAELQCLLNKKMYAGLPSNGYFGPKTETAVRTWQRNHGLVIDGIVGPKTWESLCSFWT